MKKVGLGLIGLGYIGKTHLRNCFNLKSARLEAVSDISKKALSFARKMGVKSTYRDYQKLLQDQRIDAVIIALPTHLHASVVEEAAEAGKDIFVEKPLARNVVEGKEIVSTASRNGVRLMVGYPLRFSSSFRSLKEKIVEGALGEVQSACASLLGSGPFLYRADGLTPRPVPSWWLKKEFTGGGALMDYGCHLINLIRWYFGEISDIKSYIGHRFHLDLEDHATCIAKFQSEQIAVINVGWFSSETEMKVELFGTAGHAFAGHQSSSKIVSAVQLLLKSTPKFYLPYLRELEHFVWCIEHDLLPSPSGDDALKDLEAISLAYTNEILLK